MSVNRDAFACFCDSSARAARPDTCTAHAPDLRPVHDSDRNSAECRFPRAERTRESVQAEQSYRDLSQVPPSQRPLASHRLMHAAALFETLKAFDVSKNRLADMVGVNEKQVRKWIEGLNPIPTTVVSAMPTDMAMDYLNRLSLLKGPSMRSAADRFRHALSSLEREGASPELLAEGHMRLGAIAARGHR